MVDPATRESGHPRRTAPPLNRIRAMASVRYRGRFAPSPTGPLHLGSLAAALASWLDARAHGGEWLIRIEDVDHTRCRADHQRTVLEQLEGFGLRSDAPVIQQSARDSRYREAMNGLIQRGLVYPCACTRSEIEALGPPTRPGHAAVYPGTCRQGLGGRPARAWRARVVQASEPCDQEWTDRRMGAQIQDLAQTVGDFVLRRADGAWAYQLAVVIDDADQSITHVVRGEDLADNTPRQRFLQRLLNLPTPLYLHIPLVMAPDGQKLSKQTGAQAIDPARPWDALRVVAPLLDLPTPIPTDDARGPTATLLQDWLHRATDHWRQRWAMV